MNITIDSSIFNISYLNSLQNNNRYQIYYGGSGSGKSYFIGQKLLIDILQNKNISVLVCRKVARTNRDSTYALMIQLISEWNLTNIFNISKSDYTITNKINNSKLLFMGLDDV